MPSDPYDLILVLTLAWLFLGAWAFGLERRVRKLERLAGARRYAGRRRRNKRLPKAAHIREVPVRVRKVGR